MSKKEIEIMVLTGPEWFESRNTPFGRPFYKNRPDRSHIVYKDFNRDEYIYE